MDGESSQRSQSSSLVPKFTSFRSCASSSLGKVTKTPEKLIPSQALGAGNQDDPAKCFQQSNEVRHAHSSNRLSSSERLRHAVALHQPLDAKKKNEHKPSNQFLIDKVGDSQNLNYGALPSSQIPCYFRFGSGRVLGFPETYLIDRARSSNSFIVFERRQHSLGRPNKAISHETERQRSKTLLVKPSRDSRNVDLNADFIPLKDSRKNQEHSSDETLPAYDEYSYRSMTSTFKSTEQFLNQDSAVNSNPNKFEGEKSHSYAVNDDVVQKKIALTRKVEEDPGSYRAWLDLINYQDNILGLDLSANSKITTAQQQSTSEIKIFLYEKAIRAAERLQDKERLLLGMMQEGFRSWDNAKLSSKWTSLLDQYPTSMNIWIKYLDFKQSDFLSFRYEEVRTVYIECLKQLQQNRLNTERSGTGHTSIYIIQIYVTLRMTVFMQKAGFSEHAIACWQALIEYSFYKPRRFQNLEYYIGGQLGSTTLSAFEAFWESEVPRFGEDHAEGWATFKLQNSKPPESNPDAGEDLTDCDHNLRAWMCQERKRSLQSRTPARMTDEIDENDPFRITLFSDIQPILIDPPDASGRLLLVEALLIFFNQPPCLAGVANDDTMPWRRDSFLRNETIRQLPYSRDLWISKPNLASLDHAASDLGSPLTTDFLLFPMPYYQVSSASLFAANGSWFSIFDSRERELRENQGPVDIGFIRQSIQALVHLGVGGDSLAEYYIAFESRLAPSAARRIAKTLVKHRPFSIRLYNSYAIVEYRLNNPKVADHTLITTINMSKSLGEEAQQDSILSWCTWIWELLELGERALALERILLFSNQTITAGSQVNPSISPKPPLEPVLSLRTQKALTDARDHFVSLVLLDHAINAIECIILYAYLSTELSLGAAHEAFISNLHFLSSHFPPSSPSHERIHQAFARLLNYHITHIRHFTPSAIRSFLTESIKQFPHNTMFLALYAGLESRSRIDDRVRTIMRDVVLTNSRSTNPEDEESIISHFFAIYSEIVRGVTLGSNTNAIRSTFERAVTSSCGAHHAGLWESYFLFEHSRGDRHLAKAVYYRGLRACPWAKDLYLLAFEHLGSVMDEDDVRGVYAVMVEKGLRIHVSLERWNS